MITIAEDIEFAGMRGAIQYSKPVFEQFTALGSNKIYVQRLRTEPKESQVSMWDIMDSYSECYSKIQKLQLYLGLPVTVNVHDYEILANMILMDYTHNIRGGAGGKFLLTVDAIWLSDDKAVSTEDPPPGPEVEPPQEP